MKKLLLAALLMISTAAHAAIDVNTNGLTPSQKADLVKMAEQMREQQSQAPTAAKSEDLADTVGKWANVGEQFGKMIGGAAKEIGVAVNEFIKTPVGIMTAGLIIFNYVGGPIIHVSLGLILFITGMSLTTWLYRRGTEFNIEYDKTKTNLFGNYVILSKRREAASQDLLVTVCLGYFFTILVSVWTMFAW